VVAGDRPAARQVGLAALDPVVELPSGAHVRLGTHEWVSGAVSPAGHVHLERFDLTDGLPRWRWRLGDVVVERELAMVPNRSALGVVHRLRAGGPVRLRLEALCTWRDAHGERSGSEPLPTARTADGVEIAGGYRLAGPGWQPAGTWYPWFGTWSRDTMISFEGLFLATGRAAEGRALLERYAATLDDGMLANTADTGQVEYNTVDATLWFVHAVDAYVSATGDTDL